MKALHINGSNLTLEHVSEVVYQFRPVLLDPDAREAVDRARAVVDTLVAVHSALSSKADSERSWFPEPLAATEPAASARAAASAYVASILECKRRL